jgi:CTD nuclear envelope phosphatase 1
VRTQTWSKPLTQRQAPPSEETRPAKRSFSLPAFAASSATKKSINTPYAQTVPSSPVERTSSKFHQRIRRLYLVRAFVVLWNTVCEAWKWVVRRGITRSRTHSIVIGMGMDSDAESATSGDEKDSEEELDPLVTRALPQPATDLLDSVHHASSIPFPESSPSPPSVSPASQIPSPEYLSLKVLSSSRIKTSSLLPNPFATSLLTHAASSHISPQSSPTPTSLPSTPPPSHPRKTPFHLPKTLVLDLDETLIHSTSRPMQGHGTGGTGLLGLGGRRNKGAGHMVEVVLGGRSTLYHVYKRPFVDYFLRKVRSHMHIVLDWGK